MKCSSPTTSPAKAGWTSVPDLTGKTRYTASGMTSGTPYLFRVRALGLGAPGPFSATTQQMAP